MRSSPKTFPLPTEEESADPFTTTTLIMPNCACVLPLLLPPTEEADLAMRRRRREGRLPRLEEE